MEVELAVAKGDTRALLPHNSCLRAQFPQPLGKPKAPILLAPEPINTIEPTQVLRGIITFI